MSTSTNQLLQPPSISPRLAMDKSEAEEDKSILPSLSWEEDFATRTNPALLTRLLRKAVPILDYIDFSVAETRRGFVKVLLPLSEHSANQHGVHQAAVLGIAADYAGGIALGSVIPGVPIIGVHPQTTNNGASLWALNLKLDYKLPSSSHVVLTAKVLEDKHDRIASRYFKGRMVIETVDIALEGEDELFATSSITYFIRQASGLKPSTIDATPNAMFKHKHKASARLIAGLRAMEQSAASPLFIDEYSEGAASEHGCLLAKRFQRESPQLKEMIANRTKDIDDWIKRNDSAEQVVIIGAGFDFRPFRLSAELRSIPIFEVDLPTMLVERERIVSKFPDIPQIQRISVSCNLELQDVANALIRAGLNPNLPTLFVMEGVTMYFDERLNEQILKSIQSVMISPESRLWVDVVDACVFEPSSPFPEVSLFLEGIASLGEPFTWGTSDRSSFFRQLGLRLDREVPSDCFRPADDPVFDLYRFCHLSAAKVDGAEAIFDGRMAALLDATADR